MSWHDGMMCGFDLESTGTDPERDRAVQISTALVNYPDPGPERPARLTTIESTSLVNPGIPIPPETTQIHGIDDARVADAPPEAEAIPGYVELLAQAIGMGAPVVGMNLAFDLTLLDRSCRRLGVKTLHQRVGREFPVIDVYVIDKYIDPFRKGKRRLANLAQFWGVQAGKAHDSTGDAYTACRVAWKMGHVGSFEAAVARRQFTNNGSRPQDVAMATHKVRLVSNYPLMDLHFSQVAWRAQQCASLERYLHASGKLPKDEHINQGWPVIPVDGMGTLLQPQEESSNGTC